MGYVLVSCVSVGVSCVYVSGVYRVVRGVSRVRAANGVFAPVSGVIFVSDFLTSLSLIIVVVRDA